MVAISSELRRWYSKPFVGPTPANRGHRTFEPKTCAHCGSVTILGGDLLTQSRKNERFFCDIQCAGEFKKWHNRTAGYRAKATASVYRVQQAARSKAVAAEKRNVRLLRKQVKLEAVKLKWKCCSWCDRAFLSFRDALFCSKKCNGQRLKALSAAGLIKRELHEIVCERCNKKSLVSRDNARFCSEKCRRKSSRSNRDHLIRSHGMFGQKVSLAKLMKKHKSKCAMCGVKCTKPRGLNEANEATIDHIVPLSRSGLHIESNTQILCRRCNTIKNDCVQPGLQLMLPLATPQVGV